MFVCRLAIVDPETQSNQTRHLEQLALAELDVANRQLSEAGRTIDELRADVLALATRVDGARAEAEAFRDKLQQEHTEAREMRQQLIETGTAAEKLRSTIVELEAHNARLKKQLQKPERLMAKKILRRGPYATPDAS